MTADSVLWVHEPDGQVMRLPRGVGHHLRPLGWHPDDSETLGGTAGGAAPKAAKTTATKPASKARKPASTGSKRTLK